MLSSNNFITNIAIVGVGHAGCEIANIISNNKAINTFYVDTDSKALENYENNDIVYLDKELKFSSLENNNELIACKMIAIKSLELIKEKLKNVEILILTGGLGGSTGSAILPIIAKAAKEMKILTISIVSTPFSYEGTTKELNSQKSLIELEEISDITISVSNNKVIENYPDITISDVFKLIDKFLVNSINCFINLFSNNLINISKTDLLNSLKNKGESYIGFGSGIGKKKIARAIDQCINSKLIDKPNKTPSNVILVLVGDPTMKVNEINGTIEMFKSKIENKDVNIIISYKHDPNLVNEIKMSIISTFSKKQDFKAISSNDNLLQSSQELLIEFGNFPESNYSNYVSRELDLSSFSKEKLNNNSNDIDDKVQDDNIIVSDETKDDDIPFFLK